MTSGAIGTVPPTRSRFGAWSAKDEQWKRKLAAILVAFAFGFLLAWFLKKCPQPGGGGGGGGGGDGGGGGGGAAAPGKGAPQKLGQGAGGAGGGGGVGGGGVMKVQGSGTPDGSDGDGPDGTGDSPAGKPGQDDQPPPSAGRNGDSQAGDAIIKTAEGRSSGPSNVKEDTLPAGPPPPNLQMAKDFSLDSTGLPRYSTNVTNVASGVVTDTARHKKSSMASIVTTDKFDDVVSFYKGQMPAGWHASVIGDMDAMKKSLSPSAIQNMISGALNGGAVDTASITAAQSGHGTGVAIFEPPNQTTDPRSIMVMTQPGKPVQVVMTKKLQQ